MSNKRNNISDKLQAKKDIVLNSSSGKKFTAVHILAIGVIIAAGIIAVVLNSGNKKFESKSITSPQSSQDQKVNNSQNDTKEFSYEASLFNDKKAKYYQYQHGKILIKYFILKSQDGQIRAAFDACDVCWPEGKGYAQDSDEMICRNCGQRFPSNKINIVKGGCNPSPLNITVQNGMVIIKTSEIIQGSRYFDFSKKG